METFLLEEARTWKLFYFIATNRNKWYKQYESVKQFTRLLKMFKKSGTKMLKAFKPLQHAKQWKLPTSFGNMEISNVIVFGCPSILLAMEIFTVKMILRNIFTAFFTQRKMTMEIPNVILFKMKEPWKFSTSPRKIMLPSSRVRY